MMRTVDVIILYPKISDAGIEHFCDWFKFAYAPVSANQRSEGSDDSV